MPAVAVLGAGPAGCAIALHLHRAGFAVAIFTAPGARRFGIPETLPPDARPLLAALGFGDALGERGFRQQYAMSSAWGSDSITTRPSICNAAGPGWFVDRAVFDDALLAIARKEEIPIFQARIQSAIRKTNSWQLHFDSPECDTVEARWVVDASGRSSAFARRIGHRRLSLDGLVSVSARAVPANFPTGEALVESAPDGWWFSASTSGGDLTVSWFTEAKLVFEADRSLDRFAARLRATVHTNSRVATLLPLKPELRLARTDRLEVAAGENWFALGDAAFASDPLASQGLLRALESAERMAGAVANSIRNISETTNAIREIQSEYVKRFLAERHYFYAMERRWPESPFWRTRDRSGQ